MSSHTLSLTVTILFATLKHLLQTTIFPLCRLVHGQRFMVRKDYQNYFSMKEQCHSHQRGCHAPPWRKGMKRSRAFYELGKIMKSPEILMKMMLDGPRFCLRMESGYEPTQLKLWSRQPSLSPRLRTIGRFVNVLPNISRCLEDFSVNPSLL